MSEKPKCPYCGDRMETCTSLITPALDLISAWYQCVTCESTSPRIEFSGNTANEKIIERLQAVSSRRVEPKNRVLTLEELKAHKGFAWAECSPDIGSSSPVYVENGILFVDGDEINLNDNDFTYGEYERCWLRKPTETERWETPWAGDSRE